MKILVLLIILSGCVSDQDVTTEKRISSLEKEVEVLRAEIRCQASSIESVLEQNLSLAKIVYEIKTGTEWTGD